MEAVLPRFCRKKTLVHGKSFSPVDLGTRIWPQCHFLIKCLILQGPEHSGPNSAKRLGTSLTKCMNSFIQLSGTPHSQVDLMTGSEPEKQAAGQFYRGKEKEEERLYMLNEQWL